MDAIRWEGNTLYLLDQTKLPVTEEWISYTDYRPVADAIRTMVVRGAPADAARYIRRHIGDADGVICFNEFVPLFEGHPVEPIGPADDPAEHARRVFDALRYFDGTDVQRIWAQCPDPVGIGLAVSNRLNKAAGFHIVRAE